MYYYNSEQDKCDQDFYRNHVIIHPLVANLLQENRLTHIKVTREGSGFFLLRHHVQCAAIKKTPLQKLYKK